MDIEPVGARCEGEVVASQAAYILRENTGTSGVLRTAHAAVEELAVAAAVRELYLATWDALQHET